MRDPNKFEDVESLINQSSYFKWLKHHESIPSTNDLLMHQLKKKQVKEPGIILADYQTEGKGRQNNQWEAPAGKDILLSMFIQPKVSIEHWAKITFPIGLAIRDCLLAYVPPQMNIQFKWPNDILINEQKCVGMLATVKKEINGVVFGIGLNVNQQSNDLSRTSLAAINHHEFNRWAVLGDLIKSLNRHINQILTISFETESWHQHAAFLNKRVAINTAQGKQTGIYRGIDSNGILQLEVNKKMLNINSGYNFRCIPED